MKTDVCQICGLTGGHFVCSRAPVIKALSRSEELNRELVAALQDIHDVAFDGNGLVSAKMLGKDIAGMVNDILNRVKEMGI